MIFANKSFSLFLFILPFISFHLTELNVFLITLIQALFKVVYIILKILLVLNQYLQSSSNEIRK